MNRLWNAGDNLAKLRDESEETLSDFKDWQVSWVPRIWNKEADALVNKAFGPKTTKIIRSQGLVVLKNTTLAVLLGEHGRRAASAI